MPGHRFYTSFQTTDQNIILKDADEFQHLTKVLRLRKGDDVELINGRVALAKGVVNEVGKTTVNIALHDISFAPLSTHVTITLACAIPKKSKFETIIEKCTELGVDRIVPLITERTEFIGDEDRSEKKRERFERVAVNAAKQCKRLWFPEIFAPVPFTQALTELSRPDTGIFIPWLEGDRITLMKALASREQAKEWIFFIGPEGDFTPDEVQMALKVGALPVSLGQNVLKVDTAAMAVIAYAVLNK